MKSSIYIVDVHVHVYMENGCLVNTMETAKIDECETPHFIFSVCCMQQNPTHQILSVYIV